MCSQMEKWRLLSGNVLRDNEQFGLIPKGHYLPPSHSCGLQDRSPPACLVGLLAVCLVAVCLFNN